MLNGGLSSFGCSNLQNNEDFFEVARAHGGFYNFERFENCKL